MKPIKPEDLPREFLRRKGSRRVEGLVQLINQGLINSYDEGKDWRFAYYSHRVDELTKAERMKLRVLFEDAGYQVSFDSGVPYDEKPTEIVVKYDTRKEN